MSALTLDVNRATSASDRRQEKEHGYIGRWVYMFGFRQISECDGKGVDIMIRVESPFQRNKKAKQEGGD